MPDWPLPIRLALTGAAILVSALGFSLGSVVVGVLGIGLSVFAIRRLILVDLPNHQPDDDDRGE